MTPIEPFVPLSIDRDGHSNDNEGGDDDDRDLRGASPLDMRVIEVVQSTAPKLEIRPARLAAELGISVNDACAELCGLLAAVGGGSDGATFRFETVEKQKNVMVFTFPANFRGKALRKRRRQDLWKAFERAVLLSIKVLKIVTAFGLILSLLILCVAAILGLIAVIVALARSEGHGGSQNRAAVSRQIRLLFYTMRELLWCYALVGPDGENQDPFMREIAYDMSLVLSCCCGNPGNIFYWMRARQLTQRRQRVFRGWGGRSIASDVEGVSLIRRGSWGSDEHRSLAADDSSRTNRVAQAGDPQHRGLLSVAVEFLFGPTPFYPGPSEGERWKLRAAVLVELSSSKQSVSLQDVSPFFDKPPSSLDDSASILEEGLLFVSHFNGVPSQTKETSSVKDAKFDFPELMAESSFVANNEACVLWESDEGDDEGWTSMLCSSTVTSSPTMPSWGQPPQFLKEVKYRLTNLSTKQFVHCSLLGFLNLIGVVWLGQSISPGGVLEIEKTNALGVFLHHYLLPMLRFYAVLFFSLPIARLVLILVLNTRIRSRNNRRQSLARELESRTTS